MRARRRIYKQETGQAVLVPERKQVVEPGSGNQLRLRARSDHGVELSGSDCIRQGCDIEANGRTPSGRMPSECCDPRLRVFHRDQENAPQLKRSSQFARDILQALLEVEDRSRLLDPALAEIRIDLRAFGENPVHPGIERYPHAHCSQD